MTGERRMFLELADILAIRIECERCKSAIVVRPSDWRDVAVQCPTCQTFWDMPSLPQTPSPMNQIGLGLRRLMELAQAMKSRGDEMPYRARFEIRDPSSFYSD